MQKYLTLIGLVILASCDKPDSNPTNSFDRGPMLENMGQWVIIPSYDAAVFAADEMVNATAAFVLQSDSVNLMLLQAKFSEAYLAFQDVSSYEFGPAQTVALRGNLNTYPSDTVKIENAIALGSWDFDQLQFADGKGFPAIDVLLFGQSTSETLRLFHSDSNAMTRKDFLQEVSEQIQSLLNDVATSWSPNGDNYLAVFTNNKGTDVGSGTGMLVNALNKHFERYLRDGKIGIPVGVRSLGIALPEKCEAYNSGVSLALAVKNVRAIERMYNGNNLNNSSGIGLDDNLIGIGASDLDNAIQQQIAVSLAALEGLSDPLSENIINDQAQVEAAYAELQKLIVLFKVDMPSRLGVLITYQDNDGD
jgi:predicted lipoprotein